MVSSPSPVDGSAHAESTRKEALPPWRQIRHLYVENMGHHTGGMSVQMVYRYTECNVLAHL